MNGTRVQLLGAARVTVGEASMTFADDKRYRLLAYLACKADWVPREQLALLFWSETDSQTARKNLRHLIQRTRGFGWLEGFDAELEHVRWRVQTDVGDFRKALERSSWDEALALYSGSLLEGSHADDSPEFSAWLETERASLNDRWRAASFQQVRVLQDRGAHDEALRILEALLEHDPFDEDALDQFMRVAAQAGQRGVALRAFEGFTRRLDQELNLPPPTHLERLAESIRAYSPAPVQVATIPRPPETQPSRPLPLALTPFIGRELVLAELTSLLGEGEHRLITLVGPGGVGKTRVALQIAHEQHAERAPAHGERAPSWHGEREVGFVNLVPLGTPSAIPTAIAETIGLRLQGREAPLVQVIRHIGNRHLMLVIDNFEHLITGRSYLSELVEQCPNLVLLVTSREPLGLLGEQVLPVEAFYVPEDAALRPEDIPSLEAVQLFEQHARRVRPDFRLSATNLMQVLEVCRLVDGLPLGIELAAVWVRALPVSEIAHEIAGNLDSLESHSADLPERHRSVRAAFEHTWGLLTPEERRALRWLSVFRGGFSREAVRQAARVPLPVLGSLIDKSLLGLNTQGRYRRHRLLHQFTQEKLAEQPEEDLEARASHGQYYFRLLQTGLEGIRGPHSKAALETLETEFENIRAAWRWANDEHQVQYLKAGAEALMRFFDARGRFLEGVDMLGEAIARLSADVPEDQAALGTLLIHQGKFHQRRGQLETAAQLTQRGLALLASLDERETMIWGLGGLGAIATSQGNHRQSSQYREQALASARALANDRLIAVCLGWVAIAEEDLGHVTQAKAHYREAIHLFKKLDNRIGALFNLSNLAGALFDQSDFEESRTLMLEALELAQSAGELGQLPGLLTALGQCSIKLGDLDQALAYTQRALEAQEQHSGGLYEDQTGLLVTLCEISLAQAQPGRARTYLAEALGRAWDAHSTTSLMQVLLAWAELLATDDAVLSAWLVGTVYRHPSTRNADRERAARLLEARGLTLINAESLELEGVVRELRFG